MFVEIYDVCFNGLGCYIHRKLIIYGISDVFSKINKKLHHNCS